MIPATISTTALGSFTRLTLAARIGAMTAITLMISRPLKLAVLMGRTHSGAGPRPAREIGRGPAGALRCN